MATQEFSDLFLSAFLKLRGWRVASVRKVDKRLYFMFEIPEDKELLELPKRFYSGDEVCKVSKFIEALKSLRAMSYNLK